MSAVLGTKLALAAGADARPAMAAPARMLSSSNSDQALGLYALPFAVSPGTHPRWKSRW